MVNRTNTTRGFSLVELLIAMTILTITLVSAGVTVMAGSHTQNESEINSKALRAIRDLCAEIQEAANRENDLFAMTGITGLYVNYHGTTHDIPEIDGTITCTCFPLEMLVPGELGGPQDLNFDGDSLDDLSESSGTDLRLVPMRLTITYRDDRGPLTRDYYRCFTQTTD